MERTRERAIGEVRSLLERAGFFVSDTHSIRPTSFDLVARRDSQLLLIKVLKNIDALDAEESRRLLELGGLFPATPLVIGRTSGTSPLEPGVVYNRYGVAVLAPETLQEYLEKALPPFLFSSPGGIFARIDGSKLRLLRETRRLSLGALANVAGVSRRTIQLYEEGAGAEVSVVARLEDYLGEPLALPIEVFEVPSGRRDGTGRPAAPRTGPSAQNAAGDGEDETGPPTPPRRTGDALRDGVFQQLDGMGWEVVVTVRCPFDAFNREPHSDDPKEILLTGVGSLRAAQHRAEVLHQLSRVAETHALFIVREAMSRTSIGGLPVMTMRELRRHRDPDELLDEVTEREQL